MSDSDCTDACPSQRGEVGQHKARLLNFSVVVRRFLSSVKPNLAITFSLRIGRAYAIDFRYHGSKHQNLPSLGLGYTAGSIFDKHYSSESRKPSPFIQAYSTQRNKPRVNPIIRRGELYFLPVDLPRHHAADLMSYC